MLLQTNGIQTKTFEANNVFDSELNSRYSILRTWKSGLKATIIMFNPRNFDPNPFNPGPSMIKCLNAVVKYNANFGSIEVVNLFARCSDNQKELDKSFQVYSDINFGHIKRSVEDKKTHTVILAWGKKGAPMSRYSAFVELIMGCNKNLLCFGLYDNNQPKHPGNPSVRPELYPCTMKKNGSIELIPED